MEYNGIDPKLWEQIQNQFNEVKKEAGVEPDENYQEEFENILGMSLDELGKEFEVMGKTKQVLVGFALETNNLIEYAKEKIQKKNLDFIVANSTADEGAGFGFDTNKITIIDKHNNLTNFELKSKQEVASDIVNYAIQIVNKHV